MYEKEEQVYVFQDGNMLPESGTILGMDEEEESFLVKVMGEEGEEMLTLPRKNIFYEWEVDKLVPLFIEARAAWVKDVSEYRDLQNYENGEESEEVSISFDVTLEGISSNISSSFSHVKEANEWLQTMFSPFSPNTIFQTKNGYYTLIYQ